MGRTRETPNPKCTVAPELWKVWLANKRNGDIENIMALANEAGDVSCSKPVVQKALLYGFCQDMKLRDIITKYFADRFQQEKKQAEMLQEMMDEAKKHAPPEEIVSIPKKKSISKKPVKKVVAKKSPVKKKAKKK